MGKPKLDVKKLLKANMHDGGSANFSCLVDARDQFHDDPKLLPLVLELLFY